MASETFTSAVARPARRGFTISLERYRHHAALLAVLGLSAALNLWNLGVSGYGNAYYAAAVKSMTQSWHNFFFVAFDPGGFVTVDKPPLGFWLQVASVKIFGFNGVSLMLPQALAGVASVALLYYLVSRHFGEVAGLIAALALAVTPISIVTNRNNTIDSTLVLLVLLGSWAVLRAAETGKLRWLVLCAVFVGLGFNTKMLEAYLVLPAFALVYLLGAYVGWGKRLLHLLVAGVVLIVVSFSWVMAVDLTPTSQRPWVDSTTTNSELDLAIGYNGLQRLTGNTDIGLRSTANASPNAHSGAMAAPAGGGPGGVQENGNTGPLRLLNTELGSQIGWLLPLAVIGFFVATWQSRPQFCPVNDRQRSLVLWGAWLLTTATFFSIAGFFHTYYLVMVAPAIAALSGIGIVALWSVYRQSGSRMWWLLPASLVAVAAVQVHLLEDYPAWSHWLAPIVAAGCIVAALTLLAARLFSRLGLRAMIPALSVAVAILLAAPTAWAADTISSSHSGAMLHAGPVASSGSGFSALGARSGVFTPPSGYFAPPNGYFMPPSGGPTGTPPSGAGFPGPNGGSSSGPVARDGGMGEQINQALLKYLLKHRGDTKFLVATENSNSAAPYILATGDPVMSLGGFLGSDPILSAGKAKALIKNGTVRFFLLNGGGMGGPGGGGNSSVTSWIQSSCAAVPASKYGSGSPSSMSARGGMGGGTLYDCGAVK